MSSRHRVHRPAADGAKAAQGLIAKPPAACLAYEILR